LNKITSEGYTKLDNLSSHNITCLYIDSYKNYLFGSSSNELDILDNETKLFYRFPKLQGVSDIVSDNNRVLWISTTASGIYSYDLHTKKLFHYQHSPDNPYSLLNNSTVAIFIDNSENVWIATKGGLSKFSYEKNKFTNFQHIKGDSNTISSNYITSLLEDYKGDIWIGTLRNGLDRYNRKQNKFSHYKEGTGPFSLLANNVSVLYQDSNSIYIGLMAGKGFNIFNKKTSRFESYSFQPFSTRKDWYKAFITDTEGNLIIGIWGGNGLIYFDKRKKIFLPKHYSPFANLFRNVRIKTVATDNNGNIWAENLSVRLLKINPSNFQNNVYIDSSSTYNSLNMLNQKYPYLGLQTLPYYKVKCKTLSYNHSIINDIFSDKNHNLWVLTTKGLLKYIPEKDNFITFPYRNIFKLGNSYSSNYLWGFSEYGFFKFNTKTGKYKTFDKLKNTDSGILNNLLEDNHSNLWIGTNNGLLKYNLTADKLQIFKQNAVDSNKIDNNNIKKLFFHKNKFLVCTDDGINVFDYKSGKFIIDKHIAITNINDAEQIDSILWIATENGLWKYDLSTKKTVIFKHNPMQKGTIISNQVLSLAIDNNNNIWCGTENGFGVFNTKTNIFHSFNKPDGKTISSFLTTCLFKDSKGIVWVGTNDKGAYNFNTTTGEFHYYMTELYDSTSISEGSVSVIFEDSKNNLWIGTNDLNLYNKEKDNFTIILTQENGLPGKIKGILEDNHNNLWISTDHGLLKFHYASGKKRLFNIQDGLPGNEFTSAFYKLKSGEFMYGTTNGFILFHPDSIKTCKYIPPIVITSFSVFEQKKKVDLSGNKPIILNYNENFFSFEFASLDFTSPEKNKYKYILEGYDNNWHTHGNQRKATYTKVNQGKYKFKVIGTNSDGIWNKTGIEVTIIVKSPFWKTWWFIVLLSLIFIFIVYRFIKYSFNKVETEKKALLLEQKLLRSQMHPHFIFNSLTAIQSYIYKNHPAQAGKYLSKFAKLMRLILENSRTEYINIETEVNTLEHYLELQKLRFQGLFDYTIDVSPDIDKEIVIIPPMLAQPFIENSIEHGLQQKQSFGNINISINIKDEYIIYTIEDDGIGINYSKMKKEKEETKHRSLATQITRERVSSFNKIKTQKITLQITDLSEISNEKQGTVVVLKIPLQYK